MKSKRFRVTIVYLFIFFLLVFSFQGMAQASTLIMPKNPICRPLRLECFPLPGSPKREKLIREKILGNAFEVQYDRVYKLPDSKKSLSQRKQSFYHSRKRSRHLEPSSRQARQEFTTERQ